MNVHWATQPSANLEPKIGESGFASVPPKTIVEEFQAIVKKHGTRNALAAKVKINGVLSDSWTFWT